MALLPDESEAFSIIRIKKLVLKDKSASEIQEQFSELLREISFEKPQNYIYLAGSFIYELALQNETHVHRKSLETQWQRLFSAVLEGSSSFPEHSLLNTPKAAQSALQAAGRYGIHFKAALRRKTNPATILSVNRFIKFVSNNLPKLPEAKK